MLTTLVLIQCLWHVSQYSAISKVVLFIQYCG